MSETTDLLTLLERHGYSQTKISALTGIPQPRLSKWASGESPRSADDALKLKALADKLERRKK